MRQINNFGFSPTSYPGEEELACELVDSRIGQTGSQIPRFIEESFYVCRHMFPQVSPDDIPQPEGEICRG